MGGLVRRGHAVRRPVRRPSYVCYFEYRTSYTCADGDGDPGVWEPTCSDITQEACGGFCFVDCSIGGDCPVGTSCCEQSNGQGVCL